MQIHLETVSSIPSYLMCLPSQQHRTTIAKAKDWGPRVHNDRAGEVGRRLNVNDFDLGRIFGQEGVQIVHISGLIAVLWPETGTFCREVAEAAKKHGTGSHSN